MQKIKKVLSGAASVLMTGATLMAPAFAAGISETFDSMNPSNTVIVVGANAMVEDVVSAINVGAALGQHGATVLGGSSTTTTIGVKQDDVDLESTLNFGNLKDTNLAGLIDGKVTWDSDDVDVEEIVNVDGVKVMTSADDEDFGANVYLGTSTSSGSMVYTYRIKDNDFNASLVTDDKSIDVRILGKPLTITEIGSNYMKVKEGIEQILHKGDSVTVDGKTVTILGIGEDTISVDVDGTQDMVSTTDGATEIGSTGIEVEVKSVLYDSNDAAASQALVRIGKDIVKTIYDGDPMEMFGEPDDSADAMWVWGINKISDNEVEIKAVHNQKLDSDKEPVAPVGGSLNFPDDYAKVTLAGLTTDDYAEYTLYFDDGIRVKYDESGADVTNLDDQKALILKSDKDGEGFKVNVGGDIEETDTIYLIDTGSTVVGAYENSDGDVQEFEAPGAEEGFNITYGDTVLTVSYQNDTAAVALTITGVDDGTTGTVVVDADIANKKLGAESEDSEANELLIDGVAKGTSEDDYRTKYGVVFESPDTNGANDEVIFKVPSEQVQATVVVTGPESTGVVTTSSGKIEFMPVNNVAKLDVEATADKTTKNLILVGGPYVNDFVAELAEANKTPSPEYWSANLRGKAIIQVIDDAFTTGKVAMVVAGWSKEDTANAADKLVSGGLDATAVEIQGSTVSTFNFEGNTVEEENME